MKRMIFFLSLFLTALFTTPQAFAEDDFVYGRELMTQQELMQHRQKMRSLQGEEREAYRKEHHEQMQERAKERGVKIPDEPGAQGKGMGQGGGK